VVKQLYPEPESKCRNKLAIEIDGGVHFEAKQVDKDNFRTEYLQSFGIRVVRFTIAQVLKNPKGVVESIKEIVGE
jgi:leucyl-tRNA synthetase